MKPTIKDTILKEQDVALAISMLSNVINTDVDKLASERLQQICTDYELMCDSMRRGIRDPKGGEVYNRLLCRLYQLYTDVRMTSVIRHRRSFQQIKSAAGLIDESEMQANLEGFVQEIAMASLLNDTANMTSLKKIYALHQRYMNDLFCYVLSSNAWSDSKVEQWQRLLLSPTVDVNDCLLIVSAITISLLTTFDAGKWLVLTALYEQSQDESIRQRALIGLCLAMPHGEQSLFTNIKEAIDRLQASEKARRDMLELQMQIVLNLRAEADNAEMQRDIMPTIMRNSNLKMSGTSIIDTDNDSSLSDILGNDAYDERMVELEQSMNKMMEMQRAGSDIYFGGFAHMKRFSFFYQLSNWFVPFYSMHPDVSNALRSEEQRKILNIVSNTPFCDSDKYSFVFALSSIADKLPDNVKEMLAGQGNTIIVDALKADVNTPIYIRRMYLQNLYRFFRLYSEASDFENPFQQENDTMSKAALFFANPILRETMKKEIADVAKFLFRNKRYADLPILLAYDDKSITTEVRVLLAIAYMRCGNAQMAKDTFSNILIQQPDNSKALKGYADVLFSMGKYAEAKKYYLTLLKKDLSNTEIQLRLAMAQVNGGEIDEGKKNLFRLNYEYPQNVNVKRALAWAHLMSANVDGALMIYKELINSDNKDKSDLLNMGYAKWILSQTDEAIQLLRQYKKMQSNCNMVSVFNKDKEMLLANHIKDYECKIMLSWLSD